MTAETDPETEIMVEVRLSDEALAHRISAWLEKSERFVEGAAAGPGSVMIADHIPDDAEGPVILLAPEDELAAWARDSRALTRLSPEAGLVKLRIAVEAAAHGLSVSAGPTKAPLPNTPPVLSARELEVLQHLVEGESNKAIARSLGISAHTVKFHVAAILAKLGSSSRTEAAMHAIRLGLLMV